MIAEVIVDIASSAVDRTFDYAVPDSMEIAVGDRVFVAFGPQFKEGIVVGLKESSDYENLKPIRNKADTFTAIIPEMVSLMGFLADRYFLTKADCLRLFIPAQMRGGRIKEKERLSASIATNASFDEMLSALRPTAAAQRALLAYLEGVEWEWVTSLHEQFSSSALNALAEKGFVTITPRKVARTPYTAIAGHAPTVSLTAEQQAAVDTILQGGDKPYLLHGVTGSGKTEVYMRCIEQCIKEGQGAIMLVPEISLTPQTMQRFRGRFGDNVALLHSGLSAGERYDEWLRILRGEARIVVGARSAIFAPMRNVGIIIIDEEHDSSYSSTQHPRYETADIAEFRACYNHATLVLGSATPDIGTYYRTQVGEYRLVTLTKRVGDHPLPTIDIVNMSEELKKGNRTLYSAALVDGIRRTLDKGQQAMVFINRRGYYSHMVCHECGHVLMCPQCSVGLTWHKAEKLLKCHYCRLQYQVPTRCPKCGSDTIRGNRDGTQKVVSDLQAIFPTARILRMDNDTTRSKTGHLDILSAFAAGDADILVGTQMIVKGHDFAKVTFVGILEADISLYAGGYHSIERTYQLVTQVAGRAGRGNDPGEVVLQTYSPKHYAFFFAKQCNYEGFYHKEINIREVTNFPPFCKLIRVLVESDKEDDAFEYVKKVLSGIRQVGVNHPEQIQNLQGMRAPIERIENKYRFQVLMRLERADEQQLTTLIHQVCMDARVKNVSVLFEQNPQDIL